MAQWWRTCLSMQKMQVWSLGQENPLEKEMATHSSIFLWKIPWTEEPGGLQSVVSQRVRHDYVTKPPPPPQEHSYDDKESGNNFFFFNWKWWEKTGMYWTYVSNIFLWPRMILRHKIWIQWHMNIWHMNSEQENDQERKTMTKTDHLDHVSCIETQHGMRSCI